MVIYNIRNILTIIFFISASPVHAEQIWYENFSTPEKGIWGDEDGTTIHIDLSGIESWYLEYGSVLLASPDDYAKTVSTGGGRFEVRDVEDEITWLSEWIDIKKFCNVSVHLTAYETGSGANISTKYLKAYYRINNNEKIEFEENGTNLGNWGTAIAKQTGLGGDSLQIVVVMANQYSSDKVTLDEIIITGDKGDTFPPFIADVKVQSADTLNIFFNEPVKEPLNQNNFQLFSHYGELQIFSVSGADNNFTLEIEPSMFPEITLVAFNIYDLADNLTRIDTFQFSYFPPIHQYDLIINEIMADPYPPQGLPESEYIELYNNAEFPIQLKNKKILVDQDSKELDEFIILPGAYITLCRTSAYDTLSNFGATLAVKSFPSLRNSGATLSIFSENEVLIDCIQYSDEWGNNNEKSDGGWSLERIDPNRHCGQAGNWLFSENPLGGTPGFENSVRQNNQDLESPYLTEIEAVNSSSLRLKFSERLDSEQISMDDNFFVNEGIGNPDSIEIQSDNNIFLWLSNSLSENKKYSIQLLNLTDECGNPLTENTFNFVWEVAYKGDLVINEVLSNPFEDGTDFIELYNNSEKYLYLDHLWLSNGKDTLQLKSLSGQEIIIPPAEYLVCTKDSAKTVNPYPFSVTENIIETEKFPTIYNDAGTVILFNTKLEEIDHFYYFEKLHSPILSDIKGVSLERVSFDFETNDPANWHSAAANAGFATPGFENSQADKNPETNVTFEPDVFSPNLDGYNDEYIVSYYFNKPGYIGNCKIFDSAGRFILQLAKNEILATEGELIWNGKDETGNRLSLGIYVVLFEIFDMDGNVHRYKDAVALTDIFE